MQLDRTRLTIRARSCWEILDLAMRVCRLNWRDLLWTTLIFAVPCAIFNFVMLHNVTADEYSDETVVHAIWLMSLSVFLEMPIATLGTTAFLGRWMFLQDATWREILGDVRAVAGRLFCTLGLQRGLVVVPLLLVALNGGNWDAEPILVILACVSAILRSVRPFLVEIVLLERSPLRKSSPRSIPIGRRNRSLHGPSTGDLMWRWGLTAVACTGFTACLTIAFWYGAAILTNQWRWGPLMVHVVVPVCLWLVALLAVVVRYLNYLDLRIRREGWEVELSVRAADQELRSRLA